MYLPKVESRRAASRSKDYYGKTRQIMSYDICTEILKYEVYTVLPFSMVFQV